MKKIAILLESLIYNSSTNKKIDLIVRYLNSVNIREKGYCIALLTNQLKFKYIKKKLIINIIKDNIDPFLFSMSYDYVGDLAETIALIWNKKKYKNKKNFTNIYEIILDLNNGKNIERKIINYLSCLDANERWAFIKLISGGLRVGVSTKLVKKSIAKFGNVDIAEIENIWNGLKPPYQDLFMWLDGKADYPKIDISNTFYSFTLSTTIEKKLTKNILANNDYFFEYKWDGIRVQLVNVNSDTKIFSRNGEDITNSFPEIKVVSENLLVLDGELLVGKNFNVLGFGQLQKRINKKKPTKILLEELPAFVKVYDILFIDGKDIRANKLSSRRKILEKWFTEKNKYNLEISKLIYYKSEDELEKSYKKYPFIEGIMIKHKSSTYNGLRKKGTWYKWKKNPKYLDAILMYAQRGHGKRSSFFSDYTLGIWSKNSVIPIAKAYSGYTDKELQELDKFIRKNTIAKYGPVREVKKELVLELAFDAIQKSNRHKSGLSLRFPRIHRIRWDKPVNEVMTIEEIKKEFLIFS